MVPYLILKKMGCLYYLKNLNSAKTARYDINTWHRILGHCNINDIKKLLKVVNGMKIKFFASCKFSCNICIQGKNG